MFVYFLQRKGFIDNKNTNYLQNKLDNSKQRGENLFYQEFLQALFFESFAKPETDRDKSVESLVGKIKYLNGGLFLRHRIEQEYNISIADKAFEKVLDLFARYSWNLDDTPEGKDDEINPDVLGYVFEKYCNQKAFGAYYTRPQITEYLCDKTINKLVVDRVNTALSDNYESFEDINQLLIESDGNVCRLLVEEIIPNLSILDPACGSGAFLVAALKTLISIYSAAIGTIKLQGDARNKKWLREIENKHKSLPYFIKKRIVTDNLYGVDIMEEATEIAKLRLFLALVASVDNVDELEPLPNIDFNIMAGNSLIGLIKVDETAFDSVGKSKQGNLLQPLKAANYQKILEDKNQSIELYKKHAFQSGEEHGTSQDSRLLMLKKHIEKLNQESQVKLNNLLLDEFNNLKIKYEEKQLTGKAKKRPLTADDIKVLKPFHWGYHFDKVLESGGFDVIITNPPWEVFQTDEKEFFQQYDNLIKKKKLDIKNWEKQRQKLLEDEEIQEAWLTYCSNYPHQSAYFKKAHQYENQRSVVGGRSVARKINLYFLFVEQCFNLLRDDCECGIVVPSGIYTDLGTKQLREMLFSRTKVTGLFCLENRKAIFEGVDSRFKIAVLTFEKNGTTKEFPSAFMRLDVNELQRFPSEESLRIDVDMVRKLSPESLSVMEFKNEVDIRIAEKMLEFPLLGEKIEGKWNLSLKQEFNMTSDSHLFQQQPGKGKLPLYEGKMIHQFTHQWGKPKYWIDEKEARQNLLKKKTETQQVLNYQKYRLAFREIARNTDIRSFMATLLPKNVFANHKLMLSNLETSETTQQELLYICSLLNSYICDFMIRQRVTTSISMFMFYQTPVPRLTKGDRGSVAERHFTEIVQRAAKLICTTSEFDQLAQDVGLDSHKNGITDETQRAQLRAELDGIIAHLYGLTEEEFKYILTTFPIVPEETKQAALKAYQDFANY
jgi:type I restriction-modification system DNA methylase subunit